MCEKKNELSNNNYLPVNNVSSFHNLKENIFTGKKLNVYNNYNFSFDQNQKITLNRIDNKNDLLYQKIPKDFYNSRNESNNDQKPYSYKKLKENSLNGKENPNDYHHDEPPFINNRKAYGNYGNIRYNPNDTNNDKSIMIPKISEYSNNPRDLPSSSSLLPPFIETAKSSYYSSDNYYPNNSSANNKNSINFINGNINVNQNSDHDYRVNQDPPFINRNHEYRDLSRDEYGDKRESLNIKNIIHSDEHLHPINQNKPSITNYSRGN